MEIKVKAEQSLRGALRHEKDRQAQSIVNILLRPRVILQILPTKKRQHDQRGKSCYAELCEHFEKMPVMDHAKELVAQHTSTYALLWA
ncbi:uncharacterized [Tachysurus ichikawai]